MELIRTADGGVVWDKSMNTQKTERKTTPLRLLLSNLDSSASARRGIFTSPAVKTPKIPRATIKIYECCGSRNEAGARKFLHYHLRFPCQLGAEKLALALSIRHS